MHRPEAFARVGLVLGALLGGSVLPGAAEAACVVDALETELRVRPGEGGTLRVRRDDRWLVYVDAGPVDCDPLPLPMADGLGLTRLRVKVRHADDTGPRLGEERLRRDPATAWGPGTWRVHLPELRHGDLVELRVRWEGEARRLHWRPGVLGPVAEARLRLEGSVTQAVAWTPETVVALATEGPWSWTDLPDGRVGADSEGLPGLTVVLGAEAPDPGSLGLPVEVGGPARDGWAPHPAVPELQVAELPGPLPEGAGFLAPGAAAEVAAEALREAGHDARVLTLSHPRTLGRATHLGVWIPGEAVLAWTTHPDHRPAAVLGGTVATPGGVEAAPEGFGAALPARHAVQAPAGATTLAEVPGLLALAELGLPQAGEGSWWAGAGRDEAWEIRVPAAPPPVEEEEEEEDPVLDESVTDSPPGAAPSREVVAGPMRWSWRLEAGPGEHRHHLALEARPGTWSADEVAQARLALAGLRALLSAQALSPELSPPSEEAP